jgi:zinc/manganese transport system ATP-binding protein
MNTAIHLDNLTVSYHRHPAVHHVSGTFDAGTLTAVVGPNGAGKSSLLAAIVGSVRPTTGAVTLQPPGRHRVAYLPQQTEIDRNFPISVLDVVMLGHWTRKGAFRSVDESMRQQGLAALAAVKLSGFETRRIGELSVGQFQRVLFARVLLQDAGVILLDEPFNAIDARTTADLIEIVKRWHGEGRTVVAVLHDFELVRAVFPRSLLLAREAIAWGDTADVLTPENLLRARRMAEGWDEQAPWCDASMAA